MTEHRQTTHAVQVGGITIGGGAPVVVQSMTDTDTADAEATARQCRELADAGAELVRITVNTREAAAAVPEIRSRIEDAGCPIPLVGDFHFNGHSLLADNPDCAQALEKYRINPGNAGSRHRHDANFGPICKMARDHGKAIRIGVNGGSLDQDVLTTLVQAYEQARISEVRDTPVITVLQAPFLPPGPDDRRLLLSAALGIVLGGMAGIVFAFLIEAFGRPSQGDPAREDFQRTWDGVVRSIPFMGGSRS